MDQPNNQLPPNEKGKLYDLITGYAEKLLPEAISVFRWAKVIIIIGIVTCFIVLLGILILIGYFIFKI